jgi:hypothetical protein
MNIVVAHNLVDSCIPTIHKYDQRDQIKEKQIVEIFTTKEGDKKCIRTDFNRRNWKKPLVTTRRKRHNRIISKLISKN